MRKLLTILLLAFASMALAQSESFTRKTYDTLMTVRNSEDNSVIGSIHWLVRITMDATYLQDIARDSTLRRRVWISTGGKGEVATGTYATDTAMINRYGWEYWHNTNGYDYSVRMGNGIHHPIMVTVLVPATMRPWYWLDLLRQLKTLLQPLGGKFDVFGLSEGAHDFGSLIPFANGITGNTEAMSLINSWTNLEGVNPETFQSTDWTVTAAMQKWVTQFGGHYFGLDGTALSVGDQWTYLVNPMNTAKAGSAYFAFQNYGGGGHCCWNSMYDPSVTNWRCVSPIANGNLVGNSQNTMGSYTVDPTTGTNIFQWAMRQGDTTLIGNAPTTYTTTPGDNIFAPGEYVTSELFSGKLYTTTGNLNNAGTNGGGTAGATNLTAASSTLKFSQVTEILHGGAALDTTGTVHCYGGNTDGACPLGAPSATVGAPTPVTRDSAGHTMTTMSLIKGSYAANQAEGLYLVKHGTVSDTLLMGGNTHFGMRGDGYEGDTAAYAVQVLKLTSGKRIVQIASEKYTILRLNDGTIWTAGGSFTKGTPPNYAFLGYTPTNSATDYLTWHQVVMPSVGGVPDSAVEVVGGDVGGTIVRCKSGKLYGWGPNSDYLGNPAGGAFNTPTDLAPYITNYIPGGVKMMAANSFTFHFISNAGLLYGNGDNAMGGVGNGDQINLATLAMPYFVDPAGQHQYMVFHPVQITTRTDYVAVFGSCLFGMDWYAVTAGGLVVAGGRNKGSVIANGDKEPNANVTQFMPDSYDRKWPTLVFPRTLTTTQTVYPPYCVSNPSYQYCSLSGVPITRPSTTPHANAGSNQSIAGATTTLNGSASTCTGGSLITYHWYQVSGPNSALIDINDRVSPEISGMTTGVYTFRLVVTDNAQRQDSTTMTVTSGALTPPTVIPGGPYTITLPANSQVISVTATANGGATIFSYAWAKTSGPGTTSILNNTTANATATGLQQGAYVFHCIVTDSNGNTTAADVTVNVNPAPSTNTNFLTFPKRVKFK